MPNTKTLQRSFAGGEVSPEMYGRIDDVKYQSGLAKCVNFITTPQGPAQNRPGFQFVREAKNSLVRTRLIPFVFSATDSMVIELGAGYFRFHSQGATLMTDGTLEGPLSVKTPYELANPYAEADLFDIHYVQSADVVTLVHPNYAPRELRRLGVVNWALSTISFAAPIAAPTGLTATPTCTTPKYNYYYVVTTIASDGIGESVASSSATCFGNVFETGGINTLTWSAVTGASRYYVYKQQGGVYGYIGSTTGLTIVDDNITPDLSRVPPVYDTPFTKAGSITAVAVATGGTGYTAPSTSGHGFLTVSMNQEVRLGGLNPFFDFPLSFTVLDGAGSGATFSVVTAPWPPGSINTEESYVSGITVVTAGSKYSAPVFSLKTKLGVNVSGFNPSLVTYTLSPLVTHGPRIIISDTTGSGAELTPVITGGAVTSVTVVNGGSGYTSPTFSIVTDETGSSATLGAATLNTTGDNPGAVSYYEQRRVFAGTTTKPQNIWMTKSGTESNMSYSLPIRDDDRIAVRVAAREANAIRHVVPLSSLVLLTSAAEWRVTSVNSDAITPTSISVKPQSYVGSSNVQPSIINNQLVYCAARGGHIRELGYNWQSNGFVTGDLSLRSAHLFDNLTITDMAYSKAPIPILWFISSNGRLLGLTYVPEQQIGAWHQHDTAGLFQSCCVVNEGNEDVLYVVTARNINDTYVRYVERLSTRQFYSQADAFFVDSGLTYDGAPADNISGLDHLEGCTVNILADGAVHPDRIVTGGAITLEIEASKVHIGLPITADLQTLPVASQIDSAFGQGRYKNVNKAWLRVYRSSGVFIGPDANHLVEAKQRKTEPYGSPPALKSEEIQIMLTPSWADGGQVYIRQSDPLPLTVASLTLEIAVGG